MPSYYDVLGVARDATEKEIRQAYRRLARRYHPDVNQSDAAAEEKFKEINEAHGVLSDQDSRKKYDRYGDNWRHAEEYERARERGAAERGFRWSSGNANFDDPFANNGGRGRGGFRFSDLFTGGEGGPSHRSPPPEYPVEVTLEEAFHGTTCLLLVGEERTLEAKIPPGVAEGSRVHIAPDGDAGGDFYLVVSVTEHGSFRRDGRDLYTEVDLDVADAVLGAEILAPTLTGRVALAVPPNTPGGRRFRLSGLGMPPLSGRGKRGDLYVTVKLSLPPNLSADEIELFRRLREIRTGRQTVNSAAADR